MRSRLDEQLALLNRELIEMGSLCESAISLTASALVGGGNAKGVASIEAEVDRKERDIESICLKLLLHQQPVARDLRQISAALKMITDMERIGDQASDIAEIIPHLKGRTGAACGVLSDMAAATIKMVTESVDAYVKRDMATAQNVIRYDDVVDALFNEARTELISMIASDPSEGGYALDLLMIAKYFERIGDHAVNIAEWVAFSLTGLHMGEREL